MLPNASDETAGQATVQATEAAERSDRRDDRVTEIVALPTAAGAASESAPAATHAEATVPIGEGVAIRISHASGLAVLSADTYFGEDSKTALAAQAALLKQMVATADDAPQLQGIDLPADAIVAVSAVAPGKGDGQDGNSDYAPTHSDAR